MLNLVLGFFKEYWGVLLTCAFMQYYIPRRSEGDIFYRYIMYGFRKGVLRRPPKPDPAHPPR
ncbi:hypothetical protein [Candidatus Burkholderia verschuerenii]|uniref:hypothetical protein n=1 Tax=Candidatus Burkholderia verschuerenii TaxID=242163 RepID=UPI00067E3284|nr:hypothetical protein [Candidatus Burkholderia verschuerenii]